MIDTEFISLLQELVRIPSPSREESAAADYLGQWMTGRGLCVHRTGDNLWVESEAPSGKPTILLNAHIDTVKPAAGYTRNPYEPSIEGDVLYGLGTNDDGGSLVALLSAYERLTLKEQPYRLVFSATAQEEVSGEGGIDLIFSEIGPVAFGVIGEPTGMRMAVAEKGLLVLDCTAHGVSGHAARNEGVNALYKALDDIDKIRNYHFGRISPQLGEVKMTATMIQGGTQHNVIPDTCSFVVDIRPNGEYSNNEIVDILNKLISSEIVPRSLRHNSSSIPLSHPAVLSGFRAGLDAFGSPTLSNSTRCTFPTLKAGPGESSRSHCSDEYILISEIAEAVDKYIEILDGLKLES